MAEISCYVTEGIHRCMFDGATAPIGETVFGMLVAGMVFAPLYNKTGDIVLPTVVIVLLASIMFTVLPGVLANAAWVLVYFAVAITLFVTLYRTVIQ